MFDKQAPSETRVMYEAWGSYLQECIDEALEVDSTVSSPIPKMDSEFVSVEG